MVVYIQIRIAVASVIAKNCISRATKERVKKREREEKEGRERKRERKSEKDEKKITPNGKRAFFSTFMQIRGL